MRVRLVAIVAPVSGAGHAASSNSISGMEKLIYTSPLMSEQSVQSSHIPDPFRFAAEGRSLAGEVAVVRLGRLGDVLTDDAGMVTYRIDGRLDAERRPQLRVTAQGVLNLRCQRCLGAIAWPLDLDVVLQPVRAGQPIPDEELESDEFDAIEVGDGLDVVGMVEDEILLALPIAPRHENCDSLRPDGGAVKESPFARLAALRGTKG